MNTQQVKSTTFKLLNSLEDSSCVINKEGEIIFVNDYWISFCKSNNGDIRRSSIGVNYLRVIRDSGNEKLLHGVEDILKLKRTSFELNYPCHSDSLYRWFNFKITPIDSDTDLFLIIHKDITDLKLAEFDLSARISELHNSYKHTKSMVFHLAHELKTPLQSFKSLLNLNHDFNQDPEIKGALTENLDSSLELINDTLKPIVNSSIKSGAKWLKFNSLVNSLLSQYKNMGRLTDIQVHLQLDKKDEILLNHLDLQLIMSNLISNAVKYRAVRKEGSYIKIFTERHQDYFKINLEDNGIGMKLEDSQRIFEKGFRANQIKEEGHGIGMLLVQTAVDNLNGSITVNSEMNKGTEFEIILPIIDDK